MSIVAFAGAGPAFAQLSGSSFEGGDGNQDAARPMADWQSLASAGGVRHNPDPSGSDSAFIEGSKVLEPGHWALAPEANLTDKADILDAWSVVEQPGIDTFIYLAFTRAGGVGTTSLTFELNHDARLWTNRNGARIPCRRTGDVLVSYIAEGGAPPEVVIRRWATTGRAHTRTGCALTGTLHEPQRMDPDSIEGAVNERGIPNYLPGAFEASVPFRQFGEASLNLTQLLEALGESCFSFNSIWMHSRASTEVNSAMRDYVPPQRLAARRCSASGTKFFDRDADGMPRERGEPGIPRFLIWADYDGDGVHDRGEPFSVSDRGGGYVINDIRPPRGRYTLREKLLPRPPGVRPVSDDWRCSFPTTTAQGGRFGCAWGPIEVGTTPNATGRDFGNWFPAQLTVEKVLAPRDDPGRFDLLVDGRIAFPAAGNGASVTLLVPPGTYNVAELAVAPTDPAAYNSSVACGDQTRRAARRPVVSWDVALTAGQRVTCTFTNVRPGSPAIEIEKLAPPVATAGDALRYTLVVTNTGDVAFLAANVVVTDPVCSDTPALISKENASGADDPTGGTLDPGDVWTYRCSRRTSDGGAGCVMTTVDNTGRVTVTGTDLSAVDGATTILLCPDQPTPPDPVPVDPPGPDPPDPDEPGPVVPPGPVPPDSGDAARAGAAFRQAVAGCIRSRVPRVTLRGTRIASVRIFVNGRLRRGLTLRTLQRRVRPRVTLAPGRYRIAARVRFQRGTGTPPVTLAGVVRICGASAPRFTG